jgi:hypothetical protein
MALAKCNQYVLEAPNFGYQWYLCQYAMMKCVIRISGSYSSDFYEVRPYSVVIVANVSEECDVSICRVNYRCEFTACVMHKINFWGALCN